MGQINTDIHDLKDIINNLNLLRFYVVIVHTET